MATPRTNILITGGGPAGVFAAITAAREGKEVTLVEKGPSLLHKFRLTGNGRCNLTHTGGITEFLLHYGKNGRFLKHALHTFPPSALLSFFEEKNIAFSPDDSGKYFPDKTDAAGLAHILVAELNRIGVEIITGSDISGLQKQGPTFIATAGKRNIITDTVIVCTGGASFPKTGSTGDGQKLAKILGHTIVSLSPALAPVIIKDHTLGHLTGISFPDFLISLWRDGKKTAVFQGDLLITPQGLSGPVILDNARYFRQNDVLSLNFAGINEELCFERLQDIRNNHLSFEIKTIVSRIADIPKRVRETLISHAGLKETATAGETSKKEIRKLAEHLSSFKVQIASIGRFDTAMATAGGVTTGEINPRTMESRIIPGLYFAGEVIDIDGDSGGYNLQAAFSTGSLAGYSAATR